MNIKLTSVVLLLCLAVLFGAPGECCAEEPSVTSGESVLLKDIASLADSDVEGAIGKLSSSINPSSSAALDYTLGALYERSDEPELALKAYEEAVRKFPHFLRGRVALARVFAMQGFYENACDVIKPVFAVGDFQVFKLAGYCYLMRDMPEQADIFYRKALALEPEDFAAQVGLARSSFKLGRLNSARAILEKLLSQRPDAVKVRVLLASVMADSGELTKAAALLEGARRLGELGRDELVVLGELYLELGLAGDAFDVFVQAFSAEHVKPDQVLGVCRVFLSKAMPDEALGILKSMGWVDSVPSGLSQRQQARYYNCRGFICFFKSELDDGLEWFLKTLEMFPLDPLALEGAGKILARQNRYARALYYLDQAAGLENPSVDLVVCRAMVYCQTGDAGTALEILEKAYEKSFNAQLLAALRQVEATLRVEKQSQG